MNGARPGSTPPGRTALENDLADFDVQQRSRRRKRTRFAAPLLRQPDVRQRLGKLVPVVDGVASDAAVSREGILVMEANAPAKSEVGEERETGGFREANVGQRPKALDAREVARRRSRD